MMHLLKLTRRMNYNIFGVLIFVASLTFAQEKAALSLNNVIEIAEKKSIDAFRVKNLYKRSYYQFKNFKAGKLPTINLNFEPLTFNKTVTQRYDAILDRDVYRTVETLSSNAGLNLSQNILATGGRVFLNSNINRFENVGDSKNLSFNNNIIRIGFEQSIFGYNRFKWSKKIEPLRYERAKGVFIEENETLHIRTTQLFFDLAAADLNQKNSETNLKNAKKLYDIGSSRFKIATVNQEELLNLELNVLNAEIALRRANRELMDNKFSFVTYLGLTENIENINLAIPEVLPPISVDIKTALLMAENNSSEVIDLKLKELNTLDELEEAKANRRFTPNISGSIGLNKSDEKLSETFIDPLTQNRFSLKLDIPIVDWGIAKRRVKIAKSQNELTTVDNEQQKKEFLQRVRTQVLDFNIQSELVSNTLKAKEVAIKSNELILERFKYGNIDIVKLNASVSAKDRAVNNYLNSLKQYWLNYYRLQKLTLMDLQTGKKISDTFDEELGLE